MIILHFFYYTDVSDSNFRNFYLWSISYKYSMNSLHLRFSSGIRALDRILMNILAGDNVVFQIENLDQYRPFVSRFVQNALFEKKALVYFRFASHESLLPQGILARVIKLEPEKGFEQFISQIIAVIEEVGIGACYIFDLLSDLSVDWYSDVMVSNFFMLTCPYLYKFDTVAYFALLWNHHSLNTVSNIRNTAQVMLDIYESEQHLYIHPLKVDNRYSPTIFMLHQWKSLQDEESVVPLKESAIISKILATRHQPWLDFGGQSHKDVWHLTFNRAQDTLEGIVFGEISPVQADIFKNRLLKMAIVKDDLLFILAVQHFKLADILSIGKRMIGTGLIGGKSVGMLLAQNILRNDNPKWDEILEVQDSYFIGSEVFYSFLVENNIWWDRRRLSTDKHFLEGITECQNSFMRGKFPEYLVLQFQSLLNYYGQSPIIVRSSSIQEDAYGNSFSGKYKSIFLANQGSINDRLEQFINAIREIYASTVSKDALTYRRARGLIDRDEQMALLVQRVSGELNGNFFFPQAAGVGFSYNPFVWDKKIDPTAGLVRIVCGLGTRAVDRTDNDYSRIVALNAPDIMPIHDNNELRRYSQQKMDLIDLQKNQYTTYSLRSLIPKIPEYPIDIYAEIDAEVQERAEKAGKPDMYAWLFTFNKLLKETRFVEDMREMLSILAKTYSCPVDIEFTVNFFEHQKYKINLLQCRPFQVKQEVQYIKDPGEISPESIIIESNGPIIGTSIATEVDRIVFIDPRGYGQLSIRDRHKIARLVGKVNGHSSSSEKSILLMGPGRWGTSSPSLGIPVNFAEINRMNFICEIAEMHEGLIPDVSLGTHFFNNLVELDLLYFALHPHKKQDVLTREFFVKTQNQLSVLFPEEQKWEHILMVIDRESLLPEKNLLINMNSVTQHGYCYLE